MVADSTSEVQIDGMSDILPENNVGDNIVAYRPIVDSVQEFSVQTNVLPAEYGRFSGGTISVVTRSGGEKYHGTGFIFARNGVMDALSYFSAPNSPKAEILTNIRPEERSVDRCHSSREKAKHSSS